MHAAPARSQAQAGSLAAVPRPVQSLPSSAAQRGVSTPHAARRWRGAALNAARGAVRRTPKSASLTEPDSQSSRLAALMSR
jgi:hypothetical protein